MRLTFNGGRGAPASRRARLWLPLGMLIGTLLLGGKAGAAADEAALPSDIAGLDRQLAELFKAGAVPGASVVLIENGQITFEKGYGFADVAKQVPATAATPFRAGSIAKGLTAIGVMALVERGRLALDAPLHTMAPEIPFTNPWEQTNPVRLVHLLEHTTGWPDISTRVLSKSEATWSTLQGIEFSSTGFTSQWKPGTFPVYNNAGPAVAGYAIEKVTGQTFDDYMRAAILVPMGMRGADFSLTPALASSMAKSYGSDGAPTPYQHIVLKPAGSLVVSAHELAQLARFYVGRGSVDGRQLLTPESVARIERAESNLGAKFGFGNGYGLGNTPIADSGITFRGHNGSIDSFTSVLGYTLRNGSGYVLMANGGEGVDFASPAAHLIQRWLTRGLPLDPPATVPLSPAELQKYAGFYRSITPPSDLLRPYAEVLGLSRVVAGQGKLLVGGKDFLPTGPHSFRRADRSEATVAFVEQDGAVFKINTTSAQRKVTLWHVAGLWLLGVILVLALLVGIVMLIPWVLAYRRGRLASKGGLCFRLLPLAAVAALVATLALPLLALSGSGGTAVQQLASIGPYSVLILACSVLYPLLALTGVVSTVRNHAAPRWIRAYVGLSSLALASIATYAAAIAWLPLRTWAL
ncbi:serine hydrolase domain-containing protein [Ideonella sp.]|uniref:serine hydrolase domain-containing protein n=1 Tax=Ideonella sp. TaxID=1929293 RepID=UPI0035B43D3D